MSAYNYGDPTDDMASELVRIADAEDRAGWLASDQSLIADAVTFLERGDAFTAALDVGAGTGRLLGDLLQVADEVTAIEPDPIRYAKLREFQAALPVADANRLITIQASLGEMTREAFDFILCSHVIQHLGTDERHRFLAALPQFAAEHAVGLLTYSASGSSQQAHYISEQEGAIFRTRQVEQRDFDALAATPKMHKLPVWHAGAGTVENNLRTLGCEVLRSGPYRSFNHRAVLLNGTMIDVRATDAFVMVRFP